MRVLVIGYRHSLLPFAWRLVREDNEVDVVIWSNKGRYNRAWEGKFNQLLTGKDKRSDEAIATTRKVAVDADVAVVTNVPRWRQVFSGYPRLFAMLTDRNPEGASYSDVQVGAWFDGEGFVGAHLLVEDRGLFPGGGGPEVTGGLTLVRPHPAMETQIGTLLLTQVDELKSEGFKGLVQMGLRVTPGGDLTVSGLRAGWPFMHTHAFVGAIDNLTQVLEGYEPAFLARYTVVLPVSRPPWPMDSGEPRPMVVFEGLPKETLRATFFHDIQIPGEGKVQTAGLDGLVGVVQGSADTLLLARKKALTAAESLEMPERQVRSDTGARVEETLALMEEIGHNVV